MKLTFTTNGGALIWGDTFPDNLPDDERACQMEEAELIAALTDAREDLATWPAEHRNAKGQVTDNG